MTTIAIGGFGKAKKVSYKGKTAVVKYINISHDPSATLATSALNRENAKYEAEIMKLFKDSTNIATIYEVEGHAIYMKYYPLGSLEDVIKSGKANRNRYKFARDIIWGLYQIHNLNYVHCDLKAKNILCELSEIKEVFIVNSVISDFGSARKKGSQPISYTPGFVPPDFSYKPVSFEADIYSLGKVFLQLFKHVTNVAEIDFNNFDSKLKFCDFANHFIDCTKNYQDYQKEMYYLVKNCLNPIPEKRPKLSELYSFVEKQWKIFPYFDYRS